MCSLLLAVIAGVFSAVLAKSCSKLKDRRKCSKKKTKCFWNAQANICSSLSCDALTTARLCAKSPKCKWVNGVCIVNSGTNIFSCPDVGDSVDIEVQAGNPVTFIKSVDNELCTLVSWDGTSIKPVGRSYNGYDWESYASQGTAVPTFTCETDSCTVTLPTLFGANYQLTTFAHSLPPVDITARFLEQASFGPTKASIASFTGEVSWIKDQIENVPLSSHRQLFREHANYRFEIPNRMGIVTQPCDANTHYRKYAFTEKDDGRWLELKQAPSGKFYLMIDGEARTVVGDIKYYLNDNAVPFPGNGLYEICDRPQDGIGKYFALRHPSNGCVYMVFDNVDGNPVVYFDATHPPSHETVALPNAEVQPVNQALYGGAVEELFVNKDLTDNICNSIPSLKENRDGATARAGRFVAGVYNGEYFLHDSRFILNDNTLESPIQDGGGSLIELTKFDDFGYERWSNEVFITTCSNVPRTFLNEDSCVLSYESSLCTPADTPNAIFYAEDWAMGTIFEATGGSRDPNVVDSPAARYVYAVDGLRNDRAYVNAPCTPGARSRWLKMGIEYCNDNSLLDYPPDIVSSTTKDIFEDLIRKSADPNEYLRDIILPMTGVTGCSANAYNFTVLVDEICWKNVDPDLLTVYDFTNWVKLHPGGGPAIQQFAQWGKDFQLKFPEWHPLPRWYDSGLPNLIKIGRLGDRIPWSDLPVEIAGNSAIASSFGAQANIPTGGGGLVCGSPFEVSNNPFNFGANHGSGFDLATDWNSTGFDDLAAQRAAVWMQLALHAPDQLRQRVAWALSQIFVISPDSIDSYEQSEHFLTYYDIFVRNAFSNFRDILKEVAYSPMMAEMLTYLKSQSTAYIWANSFSLEYADENFAREVMQLFTIGLYELNGDGTQKLADGVPLRTYSNVDISEYARVWTGFDWQIRRGNVEEPSWDENRIDPMQIRLEWRDYLPKMGLNSYYIGDGWPLCSDLPHQHFLKAGATFRLLGTRPNPELHKDPSWGESGRPSLEIDSLLYKKLCNKVLNSCSYQAKVVLDEDLGLCTGFECNIDTLRVFKVGDVFYEYVRLPCVHQAFYNNAKLVKTVSDDSNFMCADPRTDVASTACCVTGSNDAVVNELFSGERVTFDTATNRCNHNLCDRPEISECGTDSCDESTNYWTSESCELQVKIDLESRVAIVHKGQSLTLRTISQMVQEDTKVFFRVNWTGEMKTPFVENYDKVCNSLGCVRDSFDNLCLCDAFESEKIAFAKIPTPDEALSLLTIGAFEPSTQATESNSRIEVYSSGGTYSKDTVFAIVDDNGIRHLRKNTISTVSIGNAKLSFRNPVHFISLADPEIRDAQYETDAALNHYFYHPNTAPFVAIRLAQRFGISNPSPRYVEAIATAFRLGRYDLEGTSFGTGRYGDLAATIAAVLLDRESRTALLEADPAYGSLLEPFLKYVRVMRSLEYAGDADRPFVVFYEDLEEQLGEEPYKPPSVFSFFKPEYSPSGRISQAGMVGPEGQVLTGPNIINFFDGVFSLLKYGHEWAYGGFGYARSWNWEGNRKVGTYDESYGHTTALLDGSTAKIVDTLATLLTSGRLSGENRAIITSAYDNTLSKGKTPTEALINAEQLVATTPEFHSNTIVQKTGVERTIPAPLEPSKKPYKAVINILLDGGMDSYNLLVPHAGCSTNSNGENLRVQYENERGDLAFTDAERKLIVTAADQPCSKFAIHDEMKVLADLYNDKQVVFFANTGVINRNQMTKQNYEDKTETQLFAHNAMQEEAQKVDPFREITGTGVLGRAADVLVDNGYVVNKITIDNPAIAVVGSVGESPTPLTVSQYGVSTFNERPSQESYFKLQDYAFQLNSETRSQSSIFGETWSDLFVTAINDAKNLQEYVESASLSDVWNGQEETELWYKFSTVAKLIKSHDMRGTDRDFFYFSFGSWDHHTDMKNEIRDNFKELNNGLELFVNELKAQNAWDDVTIVFTSDFARTITSNSGAGSDHAWGGHYWMMGGSVDGGQILGKYPDDITTEGPLNIGRGAILPTTSWDAIWNGVAEWMGVNSNQLEQVLPNRYNVVEPGFQLFTANDLYK